MKQTLNRELKAFCADFRPIRRLLKEIGALRTGTKRQVDYFYRLPPSSGGGTQRLKLRVEGRKRYWVYYHDRRRSGAGAVEFQLFPLKEPAVKELLDAALGIKTVVRKRREVWTLPGVIFNLDDVEQAGRIFEIEVAAHRGIDAEAECARLRALFAPHLGPTVGASNEDLVGSSAAPRLPAAGEASS